MPSPSQRISKTLISYLPFSNPSTASLAINPYSHSLPRLIHPSPSTSPRNYLSSSKTSLSYHFEPDREIITESAQVCSEEIEYGPIATAGHDIDAWAEAAAEVEFPPFIRR